MRTRIRGLVAVVIASAAIGGSFAAPASADPPLFQVTVSCEVAGNPVEPLPFTGTMNDLRHKVVNSFRKSGCDQGTFESTFTKL